jgi:hypothetical protein
MKKLPSIFAIGLLLLFGINLAGAGEVKVIHPGPTPEEYKLKEEQFSTNSGSRALSYIDKYLRSFASSIAKCNTWGSHATLSVYAKTI